MEKGKFLIVLTNRRFDRWEEDKALESGVFLNEAVDFTNLWVPSVIIRSLYWYDRVKV